MQLTRRKFGLLSLGSLAAATLMSRAGRGQSIPGQSTADTSAAPQDCSDLSTFQSAVSWPAANIRYWVSGYRYKTQGLETRALLAVFLKQTQTADSYIDKVILVSEDSSIVAAQYFSDQDKMSSGFLPYLIFDNVNFSANKYFLYIQQRTSGQTNRFRYTLVASSDLQRSTLASASLPAVVRADLTAAPLGGVVYSPFYFPAGLDIARHFLQAWVQSLDKTGAFQILIKCMHEDVSTTHYMRYFIVTDPVGRVLGMVQRKTGDPTTPVGFVSVGALSESDRNRFGLIKDDVANINDCPYVMVFCDDVAEVIMSATLWLR